MRNVRVQFVKIIVFCIVFVYSCEKEIVPNMEIIDCDKFQYLGIEYFVDDSQEYGNEKMILTFPAFVIYSVEEIVEKTFLTESNDSITFKITFLDGCIEFVKPK